VAGLHGGPGPLRVGVDRALDAHREGDRFTAGLLEALPVNVPEDERGHLRRVEPHERSDSETSETNRSAGRE
jgi:hypothetical protein